MKHDARATNLEKLLLWEILAAEPANVSTVMAGHHIMLNNGSCHHVTRGQHGELISTPAFNAPEDMGDWLLVTIPNNSTHLDKFGQSAAYRNKAIKEVFDNNRLQQGFDYEIIMSYYDKTVEDKKIWKLNTPPDSFVVAINASTFQHLAARMLNTLADPKQGMNLTGFTHTDRYMHSFQYPDVPISRAVTQILHNARMDPRLLEKIKRDAVTHENFEFGKLLGQLSGNGYTDLIQRQREAGGASGFPDL